MPAKKERSLGLDEIQRLISAASNETESRHSIAGKWPGAYNLRLIAEAADKRNQFVTFDSGKRFKIKYDDKKEVILIKPAEGGFAPCGYFGYKKLKEALKNE